MGGRSSSSSSNTTNTTTTTSNRTDVKDYRATGGENSNIATGNARVYSVDKDVVKEGFESAEEFLRQTLGSNEAALKAGHEFAENITENANELIASKVSDNAGQIAGDALKYSLLATTAIVGVMLFVRGKK